jgi:hypothetical protein
MELISYFGLAMGVFAILDKIGVQIFPAISISTALFFVISISISIHRLWSTRENEFKLYTEVAGNSSKIDIISAKESILMTHFTKETPSNAYIELLLDKLREGVIITRILPKNIDLSDSCNEWLSRFCEYKGKGYTEYFLDANTLPMDIAIYDEKTVKLFLPLNKDSSLLNQCISFENEKVSRMLRVSIERLNIST